MVADPATGSISPYIAESLRRRELERQQAAVLQEVVNELMPPIQSTNPFFNRTFQQRLASLKWEKRMQRKRQIHSDRRRARMAGATIGRPVDRAAIIRRDNSICYLCGEKCEPNEIHLDHVIPLSKGGEHSPENVKVTHAACNLGKRDLVLSETTRYTQHRSA